MSLKIRRGAHNRILSALVAQWNALREVIVGVVASAVPAALTDNTGGTPNTTLEAIVDPTDTPATADALRDELVATQLPAIRNNFADLAKQCNDLRTALVSITGKVHATVTVQPATQDDPPTAAAYLVTAAAASSLATSITLANQIKLVLNTHFADAAAHKSAVSAAVATADATNLATVEALANALKAALNTHESEADVHWNNDASNPIGSADATDQASANTLLNELKTDLNLHIQLALAGHHIELIGP